MLLIKRVFWIALAIGSFALLLNAARLGEWPLDSDGKFPVRDFATIWAAAIRAASGEAMLVYDHALHDQFFATLLQQPQEHSLPFGYPPSALLVFLPLAALPYGAALIIFTLLGLALWLITLRKIEHDWLTVFGMGVACGGATQTIFLGQTGFLEAVLLVNGLLLLEKRPALAGVLLGLLALKPHLAVAAGIYLLLTRQWLAAITAVGIQIALAGLATALFGFEIWSIYLSASTDLSASLADRSDSVIRLLMQSPLALALHSTSFEAAFAIHIATALSAVAVLAIAVVRKANNPTIWSATIAATLLITPYSFLYDAVMLTAAAALLLSQPRASGETAIILLAMVLPGVWYASWIPFVPISAVAILIVCILTIKRSARETRPAVGSGTLP